jgi:hypothetical protein
MTECPVCKGIGVLLVLDEKWQEEYRFDCAYCECSGYIATELEEEDENQQ